MTGDALSEQAAYAAGVYDAAETDRELIGVAGVALPDDVGLQKVLSSFEYRVTCMNGHKGAGGTLGEFRKWAAKVWTGTTRDGWTAAQVMLLEGCHYPPVGPTRMP